MLLGSPVHASEPAVLLIRHGPCAPVSHEPPRRPADPCTGARGATSYWASVVANSPGHMSNFGAQGTRGSVAAPGELARLASLQPGRPDVLEGTGGQPLQVCCTRCLSKELSGAASGRVSDCAVVG